MNCLPLHNLPGEHRSSTRSAMAQPAKITEFFSTPPSETDKTPDTSSPRAKRPLPETAINDGDSALQSGKRKFPRNWLSQFPWLGYDSVDNSMFCKLCRTTNQSGARPWCSGTRNFRFKTIKEHLSSAGHRLAVAAAECNHGALAEEFRKSELTKRAAVTVALKTVYWIAGEEVANMKYKSLLAFLQDLKLPEAEFLNKGKNANYTSPDIFNQLLTTITNISINSLKQELKHSPFIAIGVDESTDRSNEQHVAVVVRYISSQSEVKTTFLCCKSIASGTASSIFSAVSDALKSFNIPFSKVVGLGTDGASIMSSPKNGLNGLVVERNPFCVFIHCICHRLHLAASQACNQIPTMKALVKIVASTYNFIQTSPKRLEKFKDIARILDLDSVKFKRVFEIRWLSLCESLVAIIRNYEALHVLLEEEAAAGDPVAIGLHHQLTSYKYLLLLSMTADVLSVVNHLSRLFQHSDICFSAFGVQLTDCLQSLDDLATQNGPFVTNLEAQMLENEDDTFTFKNAIIKTRPSRGETAGQRETFLRVRGEFFDNLRTNIDQRFPRVEVISAMQIFEPSSYPAENELVVWGNGYLEVLLGKYGIQEENGNGVRFDRLVDPDGCRGEFLPFKRTVLRCGKRGTDFLRPTQLMTKLFGDTTNKAIFPEMYRLMAACLCVLVGNAEAERIFSCQNRIKSKSRTRLTVDHLDQLIRISYSKVPAADFDFEGATTDFLKQSRRL